MALGKYGPTSYDFRPVDADVYDTRGTAKVPTFINSTGTAGLPKIDSAGRVEFWVEAGDYHLLLTTPDGDTVTESIQVAPGGTADPTDPNAASGALHATKLAQVSKAGPVTVTAGSGLTLGFNNGGTITAGDAYWGSPNTALPLDITITAGGGVILPDDDATYDLYAFAAVTCDVADAGKMLGIICAGNDSNGYGWVPAPAAGGSVPVDVFMTTRVFAGDGPYDHVAVAIDAAHMTQNVTVDSFNLFVSKR